MALPTTINVGGIDTGKGGCRPYLSSTGNVYIITPGAANNKIRAWKATDPTSSFSNIGTDISVTSGNTVLGLGTYQVGDIIHVVSSDVSGTTTDTRYHKFDMSSDSWTTSNEAIKTGYNSGPGNVFCDITLRSDGDIIVAYKAAKIANMGTDYGKIAYARKEGTWTIDISLDSSGTAATTWGIHGVVLGASDRAHFFFADATNNDGYQRTLTSTNSLETLPASYDISIDSVLPTLGTSYDSSGTQKVRWPYNDLATTTMSGAKCDSADVPTVTTDVNISTSAKEANFNICASADGTDLYYVFTNSSNNDTYFVKNSNDGGWETPVLIRAVTSSGNIFSNIYTRSGTKYLAIVYFDSDAKYDEYVLSAGDTSLFTCDFECDFGGRSRRR